MSFDVLQIPVKILFDKTEGLVKRFFLFIVLIAWIFLLDNNFYFSKNYVISNKIENIKLIESVKKDIIPNYQANQDVINKINDLEDKLFEESNWIHISYYYLKELSNGTIKIDISMFLSIQWFWILFFWVIFFQTFKKWRNGIWELLWLTFFIILMMLIWSFVFPLLHGLLYMENRVYQLVFNVLLNIVFLITLAFFWKKKKL